MSRVAKVVAYRSFRLISNNPIALPLVLRAGSDAERVKQRIEGIWPNGFSVDLTNNSKVAREGRRIKFLHVVNQ